MVDQGRVIVGVSGSVSSLAAVHRAVREAQYRDAELVPVAAWLPSDELLRPLSELEHAARRRLDVIFEQAFGGYPAGLLLRPRVVRAEAGPALLAAADRPDDLLVVGAGRPGRPPAGGPFTLRHGSVARYCHAHARCEVLVVPASDLLADLEHAVHGWSWPTPTRLA
ncbi:universal stress protein [Kitasatospora kifunensis]|uniref:Nucleotide-binding universal stress UspA family protein n=1 Tax=Kitasatospora kifunensis TaxID=58351 RepID=A0A7W7QXP9_KITKI|nr:universal stress protein [Kitasatospora kifunensis]MBB4921697.1 nucleotide-binding universal stress UspA family protein [Kitasatospora kifunensis]